MNESIFLGSFGTFEDPLRIQNDDSYSTNGIYCLQYGSGDPVTFSPDPPSPAEIDAANPAPDHAPGQDASIGAFNQVRFGRIPPGLPEPDANADECSDDPGDEVGFGSSGFGFEGATSGEFIGDSFLLAEVTHFNRTIQRGLQRITVATSFSFDGPGGPVALTTDLQIDLVETSDYTGVADVTYCYDPPTDENAMPPAGGTLGFDVPENFSGTFPGIGDFTSCADRVTITPVGPLTPAYGETQLDVEVVGYARLDDQGECNPDDLVEGDFFYSRESEPTTLCLLAQLAGSTIQIDKTVEGEGGDVFDFELTEYDQRNDPLTALAADTISVDATSGTGTSGVVAIEPGLYVLSEVDPGSGYTTSDPVCTSDGEDATVEIDGVTYLDADSNENIVCAFVNVVVPTTTTTTTTTVDPPTSVLPESSLPETTEPPTDILPDTGSGSDRLALGAFGALLLGFGLILVARRRPGSVS